TRLASLYTTGRSSFAISYPNDPTAVILPFSSGESIRSEDISFSSLQCYPVPALVGFAVPPRSLAMYRAEQMLSLTGRIRLEGDAGKRRVRNAPKPNLRDAVLIDLAGPDERRERYLGTIAAGADVPIDSPESAPLPEAVDAGPGPDPNSFLEQLRTSF